jgi:hypothetical protein
MAHFDVLIDVLLGGVYQKTYPAIFETRREGFEYCLRVGEIDPVHPDWPLVVGDCVHNMRSALDHLSHQLHLRHYRGAIPPSVIDVTSFPIYDGSRVYKSGSRRGQIVRARDAQSIRNLSRRDVAAIEWLQPYNRRQDDLASLRQCLEFIHKLDVADKHRHLHFVNTGIRGVPDPYIPPRFGLEHHPAFGIPLLSNTCVDTWTFTEAVPPQFVEVEYEIRAVVALEYDGTRFDVLEFLAGCFVIVATVLRRFADRFPPITFPDVELPLRRLGRALVEPWEPPHNAPPVA